MKSAIWMILSGLVFAHTIFAAGGIDPSFNASVTDGLGFVSHTLTQPDGKIIAFGSFQKANGGRFGNIFRFNANGTLDPTFNGTGTGADGFISSAALQADGKIFIGGNFNYFNGQLKIHLARLNANGSLDPTFNPTETFHPNRSIFDIVIQPDGKILISDANLAGFQSSSNRVMRFNADGTLDATFQNDLAYNGNIKSIVYLPTDKILVGGGFTTVGGVSKSFLARLNADGSLDNSFSPAVSGSGFHKILIQPDGKILLAGDFLSRGVKRLNADGSPESAAPKPDAAMVVVEAGYDVALQPDGKILVAFGFGTSGNVTDYSVVRLNADLTSDSTFLPSTPDRFPITDINLLPNGKFIASGNFVAFNLATKRYLAQMLSNGELDPNFQTNITSIGRITAVKRQPDGKILIGGIFEYVGGIRRTNIARLNADGSLDNSFNPSPDLFDYIANFVNDIELQADGKILVGRIRFSGASIQRNELGGGASEGAVIRLNANGSLDETFETITTHVVQGIAVSADNKILIGGFLENLQIPPFGMEGFRKLLPNGNLDTGFNPLQPPAGSVLDILIQPDGKVLIGGSFTNVGGGGERMGTARYNADGTLDNSYISTIRTVRTMGLASDGKIYIGGSFGATLPEPNINLARLNANGSFDGGFFAMASHTVRDLLVQPNAKVMIGGDFTSYNGTQINRVARLNTNGGLDTVFNVGAGASGNVYTLERQPDGRILVGGQFLDFDGVEKFGLVRLQNEGAVAPFDFDGDAKTDISIFRPSNGEWWYLKSSDGGNAAFQFGNSADNLAPVDFTGDGKTDIGVWRPSTGEWFVLRSEDYSYYSFPFGTSGDIPTPADFDGDAKADAAVFRPSNSFWYISRSTGGTTFQQFGQNGDVPVAADYDADGMADIAIYRVSLGEWWILRSTAGLIAFQFGNSSDKPVQGDYTGDGKSDVAIWHPTGDWFVLRSEDYSYYSFPFGTGGDIPAPGDYDGDGKFDASIFRPSSSTWYVQRTTAGTLIQTFGTAGDRAVPNAFVP